MHFEKTVRRFHRAAAVLFTLGGAANFVAYAFDASIAWLGATAAAPFALLFLSGAYLFVAPYRRRAQTT